MLRHQIIVLRRRLHGRVRLTNRDRWFFIQLYRWSPSIPQVLTIIRLETLVRWHQVGIRRYWRWPSRRRAGRPPIEAELRALIRQMSTENLRWGAPRIHGELLKLGSCWEKKSSGALHSAPGCSLKLLNKFHSIPALPLPRISAKGVKITAAAQQ